MRRVNRLQDPKRVVHQIRHSHHGRHGTWRRADSGTGRRIIHTMLVCPECGISQSLRGYAIADDGTIPTAWHCTTAACGRRGFLKLLDWTLPERPRLRMKNER